MRASRHRGIVTLESVRVEHAFEDLADDFCDFSRSMPVSDLIIDSLVYQASKSHEVTLLSAGPPSRIIGMHIVGLLNDLFNPLGFGVDRSTLGSTFEFHLGKSALAQFDVVNFLENRWHLAHCHSVMIVQ